MPWPSFFDKFAAAAAIELITSRADFDEPRQSRVRTCSTSRLHLLLFIARCVVLFLVYLLNYTKIYNNIVHCTLSVSNMNTARTILIRLDSRQNSLPTPLSRIALISIFVTRKRGLPNKDLTANKIRILSDYSTFFSLISFF